MNDAVKFQVFISYAHEDLKTVKSIVQGLRERKLNVWFDKEHLSPGRWKKQIIKAINRSRYFLICISESALRKTGDEKPGFQDDELQTAYEIAQAQPDQEFTIVPVRLEDCQRGDFRIANFQQYDLFPDIEEGLDKLAVNLGGASLSDDTVQDERHEDEKIIESLFGKAALAFYTKDFEKALTILNSVIALDHNNYAAWYSKGVILGKLGQNEEALRAFNKSIEINPENADSWHNKGVILGKLGRDEEALKAFNKSIEINPGVADSWYNKGIVLEYLGHNEEALHAYEESLKINPYGADSWFNKGIVLGHLERNEEAMLAFGKALDLNPNSSDSWYNKGVIFGKLGRNEEALQAFNKSLEINPDRANTWYNKGIVLRKLGLGEEALIAIRNTKEIRRKHQ